MDRPRIVLVRLSRMNWKSCDALRFRQSKLNRVFIRFDGFELFSAQLLVDFYVNSDLTVYRTRDNSIIYHVLEYLV